MKIKININGKDFELSIQEARDLYGQLEELFASNKQDADDWTKQKMFPEEIPIYPYYPTYPPYTGEPLHPTWGVPYNTCANLY